MFNYWIEYEKSNKPVATALEFMKKLERKRPTTTAVVSTTAGGGWDLTGAYRCVGSRYVDTPEQLMQSMGQMAIAAGKLWREKRRPILWAEHNPEGLKEHMALRPKFHGRRDWALKISDESLDHLETVDELVAKKSVQEIQAHMEKRPKGYDRPNWKRKIVPAPIGGYQAVNDLIFKA